MFFITNFVQTLKKQYPNLYMLLIASIITLWFHHFTQITVHFIPQKKLNFNLAFVAFLTWFLWVGDGSLSELYKYDNMPVVLSSVRNSPED